MGEFGTKTPELVVEQAGAISPEGAIELAEMAIANMKPEMQAGEVFPGSNAFSSVMRAVVMAGENSNQIINNWHEWRDRLIKEFDGTNPEGFVAKLKGELEGFLASGAKEKLGQGAEKGQTE